MKTSLAVTLLLIAGSLAQAAGLAEAPELIRLSDRSRGGLATGISWQAKVSTSEDGENSERSFNVKAKGDDAYVESLAPARNKGEVILFNSHNMWFFKPSLHKPVSISARQKLSGQAANGDIASTNYSRDYSVTSVTDEKLGGVDTKVLLLQAKNPQVTYDKIKYWIDAKAKLAIKAEFMTLQGVPFKIATFEYKNKMAVGGQEIPFISKMTIQDAKFANNKSVIEYDKPETENLNATLFNVNNLSR